MNIKLKNKINILGTVLFLCYFFLAIQDLIDDVRYKVPISHILGNIFVILFAIITLFIFITSVRNQIKKEFLKKNLALKKMLEKTDGLSEKLEFLNQGLISNIRTKFEEWDFSKSEIEIGFLILKGFSFKEIALFRETSEKTVRDQAVSIYKKSKTKNRNQFVSYFIEDMLI